MNISDLVNRFIFYATDSRDINYDPAAETKSFMVVSMEDVAASLRNGITFPCLLVQVPVFDKEGTVDSIMEHIEGSFVVLTAAASQDYPGRLAAYDLCKGICDQITNHMIQDSDEFFDGGQVKTSEGEIGPMIDGLYGWGVNYGIEMGYNGQIDTTRWRTSVNG